MIINVRSWTFSVVLFIKVKELLSRELHVSLKHIFITQVKSTCCCQPWREISHIVSFLYSHIPYLWNCLLDNMYLYPKIGTLSTFSVFHRNGRNSEKFELFYTHIPWWDEVRWLSLFQLSYCKQVSFHSLLRAMFFTLLCLLLAISLFVKVPKYNAKVLSSVPKCEKVVMCLMEKVHVLDKLLRHVL